MTSPVERISGPSTGIGAGEARERQHDLLDGDDARLGDDDVHLGQARARGHAAGQVDEVDAHRLAHERHRAARARVGLEHVDRALVQRELHVAEPLHAEPAHEQLGLAADLRLELGPDRERRDHAGRVAGVHARLLDVLHHGRHDRVGAVADGVDVDLDRVLDEAVDERVGRDRRRAHVVGRVADAHGPPAEHVGRPHEHGVADALRGRDGLVRVARDRPVGRAQAELGEQVAEALAVLREVDGRRAGAEDRHAVLDQPARELERRLPAELHDHADRLLALDDLEHVLGRERLEVQAVGRVVVGRDGLGIAVDHHRRVALRAVAAHGLHAAVVELDALADAVRARAEDQHRRAIVLERLVDAVVARVEVRRLGRDLAAAGVDGLEDRAHAERSRRRAQDPPPRRSGTGARCARRRRPRA